jgi:phospholipase C
MIKPLQRQSPLAYGAKFIFLCARPLSTKVLCPTHWFINEAALDILSATGYRRDADAVFPFIANLQDGVAWADSGYKNVSHFFNPVTKKGIWGFASAACDFVHYLNKATLKAQKGNLPDAMFYVGAAAHLLQDVCVPHHTCGLLFDGHREYESWVEQNFMNYLFYTDSLEDHFKKPFHLLLSNAVTSAATINLVNQENVVNYDKATYLLLPLAEYSTAGLLHWFINKLELTSSSESYQLTLPLLSLALSSQ